MLATICAVVPGEVTPTVDPSGGTGRPDPATARTPAEFVDAMRRLKCWSGLGFRRLEQRAVEAGVALPRSTLTAALTRDTLPREDLVAALAHTCGCGADEVERWVGTRRRLAAATTACATATEPATAPVQLPPAVAGFAGRTDQLDALTALLAGVDSGDVPPAVVITAIAGTAGIGKTALAVHWAHRVADRFPDGQLYVNLRGFDPTGSMMSPAEAIRTLLDAFEVPPQRIPAAWTHRSPCTAACWSDSAYWWCWTTPAMPTRFVHSYPAVPVALRW